MSFLSKRAELMKPSVILMLAAKAGELKAQGLDVISLTVGEPDWQTFDNIKEAAITAIRKGQPKYTPPAGLPDLKKAVAEQMSKDLGVSYSPAEVTTSSGCKFVLFSALQAICNAGEEVIVPAPYWASYTTMVELAEAKARVVICDAKTNFKLSPELLQSAITPKTKAILLNSPSNPTGCVYSRSELQALVEVLRKNPHVVVISDDIYNRLVFKGELAPHILHVAPDFKNRVIALNGASKTYAMTGWRLGWAAGPRDIIDVMSNYQSQSVSCASAVSQYAGIEAIRNSDKQVAETVQLLKQRCQFILGELKKIEGIKVIEPEGAFYIWMDISKYLGKSLNGKKIASSTDLAATLLETELVAVVPGAEFGMEGYFRLSYALENDKSRQACERMAQFFKKLT